MGIDSVSEFFLGNKQKIHQTDESSPETPQVISPDTARSRRNMFAIKAQRNPKAA